MRKRVGMGCVLALGLSAPLGAGWGSLLGEIGTIAAKKALEQRQEKDDTHAYDGFNPAGQEPLKGACGDYGHADAAFLDGAFQGKERPALWDDGTLFVRHHSGRHAFISRSGLGEFLDRFSSSNVTEEITLCGRFRAFQARWNTCDWEVIGDPTNTGDWVPLGKGSLIKLAGDLNDENNPPHWVGPVAGARSGKEWEAALEEALNDSARGAQRYVDGVQDLAGLSSSFWRENPKSKRRCKSILGRWTRLNGSQAYDWIEFTQDGRFIVSDSRGERVRRYYAVRENETAVLIGSSGGGPEGVEEWALETDGSVLFSPFLKGNYKKS